MMKKKNNIFKKQGEKRKQKSVITFAEKTFTEKAQQKEKKKR